MFDVVEDLIVAGQREDVPRGYVLERVKDVIDARRELYYMTDEIAEYDSAVILSLFNMLWPEESNG